MVIKRIILILIAFLIIGLSLFNFQNYQRLNFYNEKFLKEKNELTKEIFLLKEIAINLEKFRLFFESIYLDQIKELIKESKILRDSSFNLFLNNLNYLIQPSKIKKNDLTIFINFREWLKGKEINLIKEVAKLEIDYDTIKRQKTKELYFVNGIIILGLFILIVLTNIFLPFGKKKEKIFNNYFSLLELLKIVKEKTEKYLEKINFWENRLKEFQKPLEDTKNLEVLNNYKKIFTYYFLNLQLSLLQNDQLLINKYFTDFREMSEKIVNLLSTNNKEKLITYFQESEEELNLFKEELINLKNIIGEIKNYEIKK
ncbi:MAG: hypothetical protein ABIK78_01520 [candidate division WOR-3 bacterium]